MFTSNNEGPACLDAFDRRNCLIACTNDPAVAQIAQDVRDWMNAHPDLVDRLLGAFVALLHHQRIDGKLIERAPDTLVKTEVQQATARDSEYAYWLLHDPDYPRDQWRYAHELLTNYHHFNRTSPERMQTPQKFGQKLAKLARHHKIEQRKPSDGEAGAAEYRIPSTKYPPPKHRLDDQKHTTDGNVLAIIPASSQWRP
jgi:hypothetical protein